eukprot:UN12977
MFAFKRISSHFARYQYKAANIVYGISHLTPTINHLTVSPICSNVDNSAHIINIYGNNWKYGEYNNDHNYSQSSDTAGIFIIISPAIVSHITTDEEEKEDAPRQTITALQNLRASHIHTTNCLDDPQTVKNLDVAQNFFVTLKAGYIKININIY